MVVGVGAAVTPGEVEAQVRRWLADFVVGLNLCPFARPLLGADSLRIAVCYEREGAALRRSLLRELDLLQRSAEAELATTLLVFPLALASFADYLDFLEQSQVLLEQSGLEGTLQLASFHPHYRFAGEPAASAGHYSNRSPYPIVHLLREDMVSRVLAEEADPEEIPLRNIAALEAVGVNELERRWQRLFER